MATPAAPLALSDEGLVEILGLIEGADSVELKLTVPTNSQRSAIRALNLDPLEAQIRQVFFFDTPDLALNKAGVVVRARRVQGKGEDSVVKLRPVVPDDVPAAIRTSDNLVVERPLRKVFSKEQRAFYKAHAPEGVGLDDLATLGPIFVLKLKTNPEGLRRRLVTEMWLYPDGSRVLELSTRCARNEAFQVAAEGRAFLTSRGVDLAGEQVTKTRKALEFFSKELQAQAG
jgi:hypothetical protein